MWDEVLVADQLALLHWYGRESESESESDSEREEKRDKNKGKRECGKRKRIRKVFS
jgi:hypothetical protein